MIPQELLAQAGKAFPGIWRIVDEYREQRGKAFPDWPPYVFLPMAGWYDILCGFFGVEELKGVQLTALQGVSCMGTWRPSQDIIRFDADVYASLAGTGLTGDLPVGIFRRLPSWGVYVETPGLEHGGARHNGFFAHLEWDVDTGHEELRIYFANEAGGFFPAILHLGPWDLERACQESNAYTIAALADRGEPTSDKLLLLPDAGLETALNLLLYTCAYGFEDHEGWSATGRVTYPTAKKVKAGWRLFPPDKPRLHTLGTVYGEQIRRAVAGGGARHHSGPRPHVRRAHWHGFWSGPIKPRPGVEAGRKFSLRWLPPIPVAMSEDTAPDD